MKIAFYATMKPPDDPVPSGDRTMARQLVRALELAGHEVELVSHLKCRLRAPAHLAEVCDAASGEVRRVAARWRERGVPDLVMTYHVYYKSPDLIGAALAAQFDLPYITVEASHAGKRDQDDWRDAQALSTAAIRQAQLNICFTQRDWLGLEPLTGSGRLGMLAPFIDLSGFDAAARPARADRPVELICVAMMLKGAKQESFRLLAGACRKLAPGGWRLTIAGDGPQRAEVERMFAGLGNKVVFAGEVDRGGVAAALARADVFAWPGWREAFGLAYLEAQAMGLPVVAMRSGGVEAVVLHGETGLLSAEGDVAAFAGNLRALIGNSGLRRRLGGKAVQVVQQERSLTRASALLDGFVRRPVQ